MIDQCSEKCICRTVSQLTWDGSPIVPVFRFLCFGILDLLRGQQVPAGLDVTAFLLLSVNQDLVSVVGMDDEAVGVSVDVVLTSDFLVDEHVLVIVIEDGVYLLGARSADVGSKHEPVG